MDSYNPKVSESIYDLQTIKSHVKKHLISVALKLSLYLVLLVLSVCALTILKSHAFIFILGLILAPYSILSFMRLIKSVRFSDYKNFVGEIAKTHKDSCTVRTTPVGGANIGGIRKYDSYTKKEVRLDVFIKNGEKITLYHLGDANEHHADYYEAGGNVIHIRGTHFPVKTHVDAERWLCPICGEFNIPTDKTCCGCKIKILK